MGVTIDDDGWFDGCESSAVVSGSRNPERPYVSRSIVKQI
jgi:hypothetical protein